MNVIPDHRARFNVAGLAEAGVCRTFRPRLHLVVFIALGTALALPAQEVSVTSQQGGSATATTTTSEATRSARGAADSSRSQTPATPAVNPLEDYLSTWMRPRDHALLRKDATAPTATDAWRRLGTTSTANSATRKPAPRTAAPTANPYIDAMNAAALPTPATSLPPAPSGQVTAGTPNTATPPAPASLAEPEAPPPPPATRYQPPPSSDAKYFPQLKRF